MSKDIEIVGKKQFDFKDVNYIICRLSNHLHVCYELVDQRINYPTVLILVTVVIFTEVRLTKKTN